MQQSLDVDAAFVAVETIAATVDVATSVDDIAFLPYLQQTFQMGEMSCTEVGGMKCSKDVVEVGKVLKSKSLAERKMTDRTAIGADHSCSDQKSARKTVMGDSDFESMMRHRKYTVAVEGDAGAASALPWLARV